MSRRLDEIQRATVLLNEWLVSLKSGYENNNRSVINAFEQYFSKLPINIYPENLEALVIQLSRLQENFPQHVDHIRHLVGFVERLTGELRAREQMQIRDENIDIHTFAKHLLFQFEPKLYEFHHSLAEKQAKMNWLLNQAYPEKKVQDDAMKLMSCFSAGANDDTVKIRRYVDFITSTSNKNDARFAAEVLLHMISKDKALSEKLTAIQIEAIVQATESATWRKAIKRVSHSVLKVNIDSEKEESIQKIYREMLDGTFSPPSKPRNAIKELFDVLHQNMVVDDNPMNRSNNVTPPPKPPREKVLVGEGGPMDDIPTYAPPPPPIVKPEEVAPTKTGGGSVEVARPKPSFLGDIEKRRKDVDEVEKPKDVAPTKVGGSVEVARPKPSFLGDIEKRRKDVDEVAKPEEVAPTKTGGGSVEVARPKPSFLGDIEKRRKDVDEVAKPKEAAPTNTGGGSVEVTRPKPSFLDEVKSGQKNLKKSKEAAPTKTGGGSVEVARPKPSFLGDIEKRRKDVDEVAKPKEVAPTKTGGGSVEVTRPKPSFLDEVKSGQKKLKKVENIKKPAESKAPFGNDLLAKLQKRRDAIDPPEPPKVSKGAGYDSDSEDDDWDDSNTKKTGGKKP